ncbi:MAG TPA: NAD(P)-binding domain-containing protein [Longimicrobiales bacterium]|nr:NAD(P)-binding domain-containing protein [Longimicrobiales bacterium]
MRIAVLGTGVVGTTLGSRLVEQGHDVMMGSRTADNERAYAWVMAAGGAASQGTFAAAAASGEVVINCTSGGGTLEALTLAGRHNLDGKIIIDVANPLDFSQGMPPTLFVCNTSSLGEQIQSSFPGARVVKALNTVTASVMVEPRLVPGDHNLFICGNDPAAKETVIDHLHDWFDWKKKHIIDVGDITAARGTEMLLPLWIRLWGALGTPVFNWHIAGGRS